MLSQDEFLSHYKVDDVFKKSNLEWKTLQAIHEDYEEFRSNELDKLSEELRFFLLKHLKVSYHSIYCRVKDADHLVEKIIRKRGLEHNNKYKGIDVSNYKEIVRDLIGVRILVLAKEEWEGVFECLTNLFPTYDMSKEICMLEEPVAYTRYGDRNIFGNRIHVEHSNKGYRSQHYIVKFKTCYCEIQVRTLSEEVYGEFDHKVKYPYRNDNKFLIRYTNTLSQLLDGVDELISTCLQMGEDGWEESSMYYNDDQYIDWKHISQMPIVCENNSQKLTRDNHKSQKVNARDYLLAKISRKE